MGKFITDVSYTYNERIKMDRFDSIEANHSAFRSKLSLLNGRYVSGNRQYSAFINGVSADFNVVTGFNLKEVTDLDCLIYATHLIALLFDGVDSAKEENDYVKVYHQTSIPLAEEVRLKIESFFNYHYSKSEGYKKLNEPIKLHVIQIPGTIRKIKESLESLYYTVEAVSDDPVAENLRRKLEDTRKKFMHFEKSFYTMSNSISDKSKQVDLEALIKMVLYRYNLFLMEFTISRNGRMLSLLNKAVQDNAIKVYIALNPVLRRPGYDDIMLQKVNAVFSKYVAPMIDFARTYKKQASGSDYNRKYQDTVFWSVADEVGEFRENMGMIVRELSKGFQSTDEELRYFIMSIQNVLIPYYLQTSGSVSEVFVVRVMEINKYYYMIIKRLIATYAGGDATFKELVGLEVDEDQAKLSIEYKS